MNEPAFTQRHAEKISRLKLILIVVCLIAIPVTFWINHSDFGSVNERVTRVESPCLRYGPASAQCRTAFEQAVRTISHPEACAILRKAGLRITQCAHAHLLPRRRRATEGVVSMGSSPEVQGSLDGEQVGHPDAPATPPQQQAPSQPDDVGPAPKHHAPTKQQPPAATPPSSEPQPTQPAAPTTSTQPEEHALPAPSSTAPVEPPAEQPQGVVEEVVHVVGAPLCSVTEALLHICP